MREYVVRWAADDYYCASFCHTIVAESLDKAKRIAMDLYNEYNSFENAVEYACPLTDMIDRLYAFSLMEKKETIK